MNYTIYNKDTGQIIGNYSSNITDDGFLTGKDYIEGNITGNYYIVDGIAVEMPTKPEGHYDFDYTTRQWVFNTDMAISNIKSRRATLLSAVDRINPLWWAGMTPEQQAEVTQYRQQLLDITSQATYPTTVEWPTKPVWL
jgi:hypothetical protein